MRLGFIEVAGEVREGLQKKCELMIDETRQDLEGKRWQYDEVVAGTGMNTSSCGRDQITEVSNACLRSTGTHCGLSHLNL